MLTTLESKLSRKTNRNIFRLGEKLKHFSAARSENKAATYFSKNINRGMYFPKRIIFNLLLLRKN